MCIYICARVRACASLRNPITQYQIFRGVHQGAWRRLRWGTRAAATTYWSAGGRMSPSTALGPGHRTVGFQRCVKAGVKSVSLRPWAHRVLPRYIRYLILKPQHDFVVRSCRTSPTLCIPLTCSVTSRPWLGYSTHGWDAMPWGGSPRNVVPALPPQPSGQSRPPMRPAGLCSPRPLHRPSHAPRFDSVSKL